MSGVFEAWTRARFGDRADAVIAALSPLRGRPVFDVPETIADDDARRLLATEWSVRDAAKPDAARLAFTIDAPVTRPGALSTALRTLSADLPSAPIEVAEALKASEPGLDFLVGVDAGDPLRAKLYLHRDRSRPESAYRAPRDRFLEACGVSAELVRGVTRAAGAPVGFVAADLIAGQPTPAKIYVEPTDRAAAARAIERLGATTLLAPLQAVPDDVAVDRFASIVSVRLAGDRVRDATLHVRARRLGDRLWSLMPGPLAEAWTALSEEAGERYGRRLLPTYVSWTTGRKIGFTVYYQIEVPT